VIGLRGGYRGGPWWFLKWFHEAADAGFLWWLMG